MAGCGNLLETAITFSWRICSSEADGKNNVPMKAWCRACFLGTLFSLIGAFSVAEFSSVNSSRRFGCTGLCSQVRPFANSLYG